METISILYGFSDNMVQKKIEKGMSDRGYKVNSVCVTGKMQITAYLKMHPEYDTCVLTETMADGSSFNAEDLTRLTDERDVNIVIVLEESRKGSEYVKQLYAAGIMSGIFQNSGKYSEGVSVPEIIDLILEPRTRKIARNYYGIDMEMIADMDSVSEEKFREYSKFLSNEGNYTDIGERYLRVVSGMTRNQNIDFFKRLPNAVKSAILSTPEYVRAKAAIESTPAKVIVSINTESSRGKKKNKRTKLENFDDVAEESTEITLQQMDLNEYIENLLRPFLNNRTFISPSKRVVVPEREKLFFRKQMDNLLKENMIEDKRAERLNLENHSVGYIEAAVSEVKIQQNIGVTDSVQLQVNAEMDEDVQKPKVKVISLKNESSEEQESVPQQEQPAQAPKVNKIKL